MARAHGRGRVSGKVLILGGRAPAALDHARRFRRQGWQVHVADSIPCRLSAWSSAVSATHSLRPPRHDPRGFIDDLDRIVRGQGIDLVLPTCEEAFHLARHRQRLPAGVRVAVDAFESLRALHSKWAFVGLARRHGLPVPETARVQGLEEARDWAAGRGVVLKPEYSRFGVHVRLYPQGIPADAPPLAPLGAWVVQAFTHGDELCSYGIADRGRLLAHALYRPAYRMHRSSSYYFDPVQRPAIRDAISAFVAAIGYTGQLSFDWIEAADGSALALECNPRATSGLHLFPFDAALPAALLGEGTLLEPLQPRAKMIAALMASAGLQSALGSGRLGRWHDDWRRADDVAAVRGDRLPAAGALADMASFARIAWRGRCSLREASTRDIEWDDEALEALDA